MKYQLRPVDVDFVLRTTNMHLHTSEREKLAVVVDVQFLEDLQSPNADANSIHQATEISFPYLAKLEFIMLNFWEFNYDNFEIIDERPVEPGFYYVINSSWDKSAYDPLNRFGLEHFLLVGYDSYLEVLANKDFAAKTVH